MFSFDFSRVHTPSNHLSYLSAYPSITSHQHECVFVFVFVFVFLCVCVHTRAYDPVVEYTILTSKSAFVTSGAEGETQHSQDAPTGAGDDLDDITSSDDVGTRTSLLGEGGETSAGGEEVKKKKGDLEEEAALYEALAASVAIKD
jgi:hypothetical protein